MFSYPNMDVEPPPVLICSNGNIIQHVRSFGNLQERNLFIDTLWAG